MSRPSICCRLLDKCFDVLPLANNASEAISVASQSQHPEDSARDGRVMDGDGRDMGSRGAADYVECVEIDGVGAFSRKQIESMRFLAALKSHAKDGEALCKWLRQDVPQTQFETPPREIADEIESNYPNACIPGLKDDCPFEALYRVRPARWISDAFIAAVCERACSDFPQFRFLGIVPRKPRRPRGKRQDLEEEIKVRIRNAVLDESADVLALPVNIDNKHWTVALVMIKRREILYYDSMASSNGVNALKGVAEDIQETVYDVLGAPGFGLTCVNSPRQFDGHSCGVFVLLKIIRTLDKTISNDVSPIGLINLRYRMLVYVLRGQDA